MQDESKMALVKVLAKGEYVKRKPDAKKVYKVGAYDYSSKRYALEDCEDISREIYIKGNTIVYYGFTY